MRFLKASALMAAILFSATFMLSFVSPPALSAETRNGVIRTGDTMTGRLNLPANGLKVGANQLVVSEGNVGIGQARPTSPLHLLANSANALLTLEKSGIQKWDFRFADDATLGSVPTLQIAPPDSPLALDLSAAPGGLRWYLWPPTLNVPDLPHTGIKPTVAVFGDLLIGDIICIEKNPMTLFMRQETELPATAVTQFFSARGINNDKDGGAGIVMAPDQTGAVNSGYVNIVAYGQGTGPLANSIRLMTRSGPNTAVDRMIVKSNGNVGIGTSEPAGKLDVNGGIYQRGSALQADYVFELDYALPSIEDHAAQMWRERHLPALAPRQVDEDGREIVELGDRQRRILEELEIAHIHIEQMNRRMKELEAEVKALKHSMRGKGSQAAALE